MNDILSPNEDLKLQITLKAIIETIASIAFDLLIDLTIRILDDYDMVLDTVLEYFNEFLKDFNISLAFDGNGLVGLLYLNFDLAVDLKAIFNNLNIGSVLS